MHIRIQHVRFEPMAVEPFHATTRFLRIDTVLLPQQVRGLPMQLFLCLLFSRLTCNRRPKGYN